MGYTLLTLFSHFTHIAHIDVNQAMIEPPIFKLFFQKIIEIEITCLFFKRWEKQNDVDIPGKLAIIRTIGNIGNIGKGYNSCRLHYRCNLGILWKRKQLKLIKWFSVNTNVREAR